MRPGEPVAGPPAPYFKPWQLGADAPAAPAHLAVELDRAALEPEPVVLAHRLDAAAEVDALRADRRVEQLGERGRHRPALVERAQDVLARGGMDLLEQRQDLARGSGRASCPGSTSRRGARARARGRTPRSPRARAAAAAGRRRPRAAALIPFVLPLVDEPVEDRLDLVGARVPGRAQPVGRAARSGASRSSASLAPARVGSHDLGAELLARRSARPRRTRAPRSPWSTCSAETR